MSKNHLTNETSPYLLQHANNPVDWYPWCDEALKKAKQEKKPILLSIGYSACHWCHVMAHESFENADTAKLMNEAFINIKVDREERPDLDRIYQTAHQILNQRAGGWPLTVFLTPDDHTPFFSGTYFPKERRYELPSFREVLHYVQHIYQNQKAELRKQNNSLLQVLNEFPQQPEVKKDFIDPEPLGKAIKTLQWDFDDKYGGFSSAPKFPNPTHIERLLRYWSDSKNHGHEDTNAKKILNLTLISMARGGIYDQIGGGFFRYSVDERWEIPHFEKMLYDNAQLLWQYTEAFVATGNELYKKIATETAEWVMREMQTKEGGYYSALDADSEGEEGKFYVWNVDDIKSLLSKKDFDLACRYFNLKQNANFEGKWHLNVVDANYDVETLKVQLLKARDQRVRPGCDDKILTSWNALMIKAMVNAGFRLNRNDFIESAEKALDFIIKHCWKKNRLLSSYKGGKAKYNAYLYDYAFMIDALLTFLQVKWSTNYFNLAVSLADVIIQHFSDNKGGFFFTSDDHEQLLYRPKNSMDEAIPASNGVAAYVLNRLGNITGNEVYLKAAENALRNIWPNIKQYPSAHDSFLNCLEEIIDSPKVIIVRCDQKETDKCLEKLQQNYYPHQLAFVIDKAIDGLPECFSDKKIIGNFTAYVCKNRTCAKPITDLKVLENEL